MKIHSLMIPNPITITAQASISEAIELMKINSIRHLPVVAKNDMLQGFITLADLKQGLIPSMLGDLNLRDLMIKDPVTVSPDDDIEFAAQLIYNHKIGGMPVVKDGRLTGIITATDILRAFIDMMGILSSTSRIDVVIDDRPNSFKKALQIINETGADIINVGRTAQQTGRQIYFFRLGACDTGAIKMTLEKEGYEVLEAMD
ncbi:MAG: CBS and ACT domain-containing protein [Desulfobacteraceae bacterium]|jgi:acetoin utilization protein AcuB|nr:CBS and ACT domain-containing protein [Desulfobacteraceae bacterium]